MPRLLVIADDLSGAMDAGVQFAGCGIAASVEIDWRREIGPRFDAFPVVVIDTRSRHVPPAEAAARVEAVARRGRVAGAGHLFKKTDSTLRGNVGAELGALLHASGRSSLCFCPASPGLGRITRGGVQYVHGCRLAESPFAHDPLCPMGESVVADILARQTRVPLTGMGLCRAGDAPPSLPSGIVIFDAETIDHVDRMIEAVERGGGLHVMAGPAVVAGRMAVRLGFSIRSEPPPVIPRPVLILNGSLNEMARRQCDRIRSREVAVHSIPWGPPPGDGRTRPAGVETWIEAVHGDLHRGRTVLVEPPPPDCQSRASMSVNGCEPAGGDRHLRMADWMGEIMARVLANGSVGTLLVIGGDTIAGVAGAMGWEAFQPRGEALPGIAICDPIGGVAGLGRAPRVLSKPGGFGEEDALVRLLETARGGTP